MQDFHVCLLNWSHSALSSSADSLHDNFGDRKFIVCTSDAKKANEALKDVSDKFVFSPQQMDPLFGRENFSRSNSIGHCRNLLLLASACVSKGAPLVLLDDDIITSRETRKAFESALEKYDLVPGCYEGASGNKIYAMVFFFDLLSSGESAPDFEKKVQRALCGYCEIKKQGERKLSSMPGCLAGISGRLKAENFFAPTSYPFDDHFFEFSSRYLFPQFRFMGNGAAAKEMPVAVHNMAQGSNQSSLVDNFIREVKSSIVESYFYFRLSGCSPKLVGGRHRLMKISSFDSKAAAYSAFSDAAVEKFRQAAAFYLTRTPPLALQAQLQRILSLSPDTFYIPLDELKDEWSFFEEEREWFARASLQCNAGILGKMP